MVAMFPVKVFWVVTPCSVVLEYQSFRGLWCLLHHDVTTQQTSTWSSVHWGSSSCDLYSSLSMFTFSHFPGQCCEIF